MSLLLRVFPRIILILLAVAGSCAAQTAPFEGPPVLNASEILKAEFLQGDHFKVREEVPVEAGLNHYTIDSDYGVLDAEGNMMLEQRVREIAGIAKMREISHTGEFGKALERAAVSPLMLGKQLVTHPVDTITGVPKGIWKFMNRTGEGIKEAAEGRKKSQYEDDAMKNMIGFSAEKRTIAVDLGVDPYTSNAQFQKELNGLAWVSFAGEMTIKGSLSIVTGGVGLIITSVSVTGALNDVLREKSPEDLHLMNLGKLEKMKVPRTIANAFLNNPALSPTHQTAIVFSLESLKGVSNRAAFIKIASEAEDENDAVFFTCTAALMAKLQDDGVNIGRLASLNGLPVGISKAGTVNVPLQWDYAAWNPMAARLADALETAKIDGAVPSSCRVYLSGDASPVFLEVFAAHGIPVASRQMRGPLK